MSDDIVTRLLAYHPSTCAACDMWGGCGYGEPCDCGCHQHPCAEAAAEIARLREQLDARFDRQAVANIVGSVEDVLNAARRLHDIQRIQADVLTRQNGEVELLRAGLDLAVRELIRHDHWCEFDHHEVAEHFIKEATDAKA